jgi:uncharacterized protein (DUF305 family)
MSKILLTTTTMALLTLAGPTFAQSSQGHQQHHPGGAASAPAPSAQAVTPPSTGQPPQSQMGHMPQGMGGMMHGTPSQGSAGGQAGMMMNCPMMMRGGMAAMGGSGMGAMSGAVVQQAGDQSVPSLAFRAVNDKMHRDMAIELTGNVDADFAKAMIAHHQGAVDMAKITLAFGKDPEIRKLAEEVVRTQEAEISVMQDWLAKQPK